MRKDETRTKIRAIMMSKKFFIITISVMSLMALISVVGVFLRFVGVGSFRIKGDTDYTLSQLISNSGIRGGDAMYTVNEKEAEELLLRKCPYLKSVKVKKKFPNVICFEVEERVLGWYLEVSGDYYALDYDMQVLLETYDEQSLKDRGLTKLVLPELENAICGSVPSFGGDNEQLQTETLKIIDTFRTNPLKERLTFLDLTNRFQIKMTLDETFEVNLGDMNDISTKLETIKETVSKGKEAGYAGGEINMITPTACSFRGRYADEIQEGAENASEAEEEQTENR